MFTQGARQITGGEGAPIGSCEGSDWEIETKSENIEIYLPRIEKINMTFAKDKKDKIEKKLELRQRALEVAKKMIEKADQGRLVVKKFNKRVF